VSVALFTIKSDSKNLKGGLEQPPWQKKYNEKKKKKVIVTNGRDFVLSTDVTKNKIMFEKRRRKWYIYFGTLGVAPS
jgi:hypothetical protein